MGNLKKNYICGCEHRVSRPLHLVMAMLLLISMGMVMTSCSGDDKDDEPVIDTTSELYGTWFASGTTESTDFTTNWERTIIFNSQGKLLTEADVKVSVEGGGASYTEMDFYCWYEVIDGNMIKVCRVYNGTSDEYVLSYKIFGNNLILEYISGANPS